MRALCPLASCLLPSPISEATEKFRWGKSSLVEREALRHLSRPRDYSPLSPAPLLGRGRAGTQSWLPSLNPTVPRWWGPCKATSALPAAPMRPCRGGRGQAWKEDAETDAPSPSVSHPGSRAQVQSAVVLMPTGLASRRGLPPQGAEVPFERLHFNNSSFFLPLKP